MLFNSVEFLIFLPVVFCLYWFVFNKTLKWQNLLILAASYFFYAWWKYKFLSILALSTFLDYLYGFGAASKNRKHAKIFLWLCIINNLGILAIFKYYNFFALQFQAGFEMVGLHINPHLLKLVLPIGISFYTFHGMSYVFDIYKGVQKPIKNLVDYSVFVSFFPLLVAGPIERANHLLPQIQQRRSFKYKQAVEGCYLIVWGFFKKVVIADTLAGTVDQIFNNYQNESPINLVIGAVAFSFQIYGDFSGYSDIALGVAKLFGFELLTNFKFPYFSRDVAEFWRRWHISLSSWFRDYLYIPLGGSRNGKLVAVRNTFIIFLVSGFWHGASWTFIIWGLIHACGFLPLLLLGRNRKNSTDVVAEHSAWPTLKEVGQMIATFIFVTIAWIFFRAETLETAVNYIKRMVGAMGSINQPYNGSYLAALLYIVPLLIGDWAFRRNERDYKMPWYFVVPIAVICILYLLSMIGENIQFIYFQF